MQNTVSVIIPTYNRASLLVRALNSVLAQTVMPQQIIVLDDGSTDNTAKLLRAFAPVVQYHVISHQGVSTARNAAVSFATENWLAFLDSDDVWLPHKLERQLALLDANPTAVLCHTEEIWIRHGRRVNPMRKHKKQGGDVYDLSLQRCMISPSTVLLRKDVFAAMGGFDPSLAACEDYALWLKICAKYPVLLCEQALAVRYAGHAGQLSQAYPAMDRFRVQALLKLLKQTNLSAAQYQATYQVFVQKISILIQGAQKRGLVTDVAYYQSLLSSAEASSTTDKV